MNRHFNGIRWQLTAVRGMGNANGVARSPRRDGGYVTKFSPLRCLSNAMRAREAMEIDGGMKATRSERRVDANGGALARERDDARDVGEVRLVQVNSSVNGDIRDRGGFEGERGRRGGDLAPTRSRDAFETRRFRWTAPRTAFAEDQGWSVARDSDEKGDDGNIDYSFAVTSPVFRTSAEDADWRVSWRVAKDGQSASLWLRLERARANFDIDVAFSLAFIAHGDERRHEVYVAPMRFAVGDARGVMHYVGHLASESARVDGDCVVEVTFESISSAAPATSGYRKAAVEAPDQSAVEAHRSPIVRLISESPLLFVFEDFITPDEADYLMELARPDLRRSRVTDGKLSEGRTSSGTFLTGQRSHDEVVKRIERRIQNALRETPQIRRRQSQKLAAVEPMQVVSYQKGECYTAHYDNRANCLRRVVTFMCYLQEPDRGGSTFFPKAIPSVGIDAEAAICNGVRIHPKRCRAIAFWSVNGGVEDSKSLHEAEPVIEGNKQIFTQWLSLDDASKSST